MANYLTTDTDLTSVADAIRSKGGTEAALSFPAGFVSAVEALESGGELLVSYEVPEDVTVISIDYTSAMDGFDVYLMEAEGLAAGRTLFICPQLNGTSYKGYSGQTSAGNSFHKKYWVVPFYNSSLGAAGHTLAVSNGIRQETTGVIERFVFASYYDNASFAAGTIVKIWGLRL